MTDQRERPDRDLVAAFLSTRSEPAFLALYDRHTGYLYRFAARLTGGPGPEPEDLVQEAWMRAIEKLSEFRWSAALRTWLCAIVLNGWRERRRRTARDLKIVSIAEQAEPRATPSLELTRRLIRGLESLPDGYREVLLLHDVEGYTHDEIARHFGIAEGTSKSQLHRARRALREALEIPGEEFSMVTDRDDQDGLDPAERDALRALGGDWTPPAELRARTVEALRARGEVGGSARGSARGRVVAWAAAAALAAFAGGIAVGGFAAGGRARPESGATSGPPSGGQYMLLLYESSAYQNPTPSEGMQSRVSEYAGWARETARSGRLVAGEKLGDGGRWCRPRADKVEVVAPTADPERGVLAGYFIIGAESYDEAVRIASGCPHLRHGGTVEVRFIEPT